MNSFRTICFASLAAIWLAMLLAGGSEWAVDRALLACFYAGERPALATAAALVTELGGWIALTIALVAAAFWLLLQGRKRPALLLLVIVLGGRLLVWVQKHLSDRARPGEAEHLVFVHSPSFPSGHAANSMITLLAIALLVLPRRAVTAAAIILALLIGGSRVMLGVHWPSDVVGGWAFGLLWTLALLRSPRHTEQALMLRH